VTNIMSAHTPIHFITLQVKSMVGWAAKSTADTAKDNTAYAKGTAESYAKAGKKQAAAASATAKKESGKAYNSAAETAQDPADYVSGKAAAGYALCFIGVCQRPNPRAGPAENSQLPVQHPPPPLPQHTHTSASSSQPRVCASQSKTRATPSSVCLSS